MKNVSRYNKEDLFSKLNAIASSVAKKPVFVVYPANGCYSILNYFNKHVVIGNIPSKNLAKYMCDSMNKTKTNHTILTHKLQKFVNLYSKHYYDCEFYKHTIKTTKDLIKKDATITRLDMSIEYLKEAVNNIRNSC